MKNNIIQFCIFYFGAMVGSFLNVLIYRLPRNMNFTTDRSKCTSCKRIIPWYHNIPILSYLVLRGKCSKCNVPYSVKYLIVEIICGIGAIFIIQPQFDLGAVANSYLYFSIFCAFVVHFFIDLEHKILPDSINVYLAICFFALAFTKFNFTYILLGGAIGFFFPLGVTYLFYILRNQVGLGGGDIKLFGALGLILGPIGIIHNILFSCILGSIISIPLLITKKMDRQTALPFGPSIIIVSIIQIYFPVFFDSIIQLIF